MTLATDRCCRASLSLCVVRSISSHFTRLPQRFHGMRCVYCRSCIQQITTQGSPEARLCLKPWSSGFCTCCCHCWGHPSSSWFFFLVAPWYTELPGQGSDLSSSHAGSLTHCAGLGIEPTSQHPQDTANPFSPQRELQLPALYLPALYLLTLHL